MGDRTLCPKCKKPQYCPCEACKERDRQEIVWKWHDDGEILECGHCGHAMHADGWLQEEWDQIMEGKEPGNG